MTSLPFIFCWRKHIFSIIIQIFTEKHFSSKFWTAGPWTWLTLHFLAFWEIYILITHWWPISIPKTSNGVEWCHMTHFFWSWWKTAMSAKKSHKKWSSIILENRNIKLSNEELFKQIGQPIQMLEDERHSQAWKFCEITRK